MEAVRAEAVDVVDVGDSSRCADIGDGDVGGRGGDEDALAAVRLRLVEVADEVPAGRRLADALHRVEAAVDALAGIDPDGLDVGECRQWLEGVERSRRQIEAASVAAAGFVDRANPFRPQGFFSAKSVLKHMLGLSGPEAHRRLQTAKLHRRLADWGVAEHDGDVGVAQSELMARIAANPRIAGAVLRRDQALLLDDAVGLSFDDFDRNVRMWETLADPDGDRDRNERQEARREFMLRPNADSGWTLTGSLPELDGNEFMAIFSHFVDAEWQTDWTEARARLGNDATIADLQRSEPQRRADALLAMARAAASTPPGSSRPTPTVNVLIDQATMEAHLRGERPEPARYRQVVCRTQSGRRLHPDDAVNTALVNHIRRVVYDSTGTIIDLGRRSRLFRGPSRDAVMLLATVCAWIGCDRPVDWCDADHSLGWKAHGNTVPRNGTPLCGAHNRHKEQGFHVHRDDNGHWHTTDPHGNEIT